jgi:urease accessory protein
MADAIIIQQLPSGSAGSESHDSQPDVVRVELPMTASDRRRVRRLVEAPDGARLALELPTGTVLVPGQLLHVERGRAYIVAAAPEDVIVVRPRTIEEATRVGHLIGNLHRDLEAVGDVVIALADAALGDRLRRAGVPFDVRRRAFHGRAPGDHAH